MGRVKITKRLLDEAHIPTEQERSYWLWDSELRGFGVRIFASGKRTFWINYHKDGKRKRMTIGTFGALTCEEARTLAKAHLGSVAKDEDPLLERQTRRKALTVGELCDRYLDEARRGLIRGKHSPSKKDSTIVLDTSRVERHIKPLMGDVRVIDLRSPDIYRLFRDVSAGKTAKTFRNPGFKTGNGRVSGGAGTARRTVGLLGAVLSYAVADGIIEHNPARGVKTGSDGTRDRRLSADEYKALGEALAAAEAEGERWQTIAAIRLLALTGCRRGEIQGLIWSEVDDAGSCLRLTDTKTGKSVRAAGRAVFDVLGSLPRAKGATAVFPPLRYGKAFTGVAAGLARIVERAGLEGVTAHTLRHSFASTAGDLGFALPTIAALLGHTTGGVTSRYVHLVDSVLIAAADKVAREIRRNMEGPQSAEILQFPGAAAAV